MNSYQKAGLFINEGPLSPNNQEETHLIGKDSGEAEEIVRDLLPFKKGFFGLPLKQLAAISCHTLAEGLSLAPSMIGRNLIEASGLIFLNYLGKTQLQAAFGVYNVYFWVGFFAPITLLVERGGISMSQALGEHNFPKLKDTFTKLVITLMSLYLIVILPLMIFSQPVLTTLGVSFDLAVSAQRFTRQTIPMMTIYAFSELFKVFCLSQGHEKVFGYSSVILVGLTVLANYYVMLVLGLGVEGWIWVKTISDFIFLLIAIVVYLRTIPSSRGFVSLSKSLEGLGTFFCDSVIYIMGVYPDIFGGEITGYFILMTQDTNQIAAYYSTMNITSMMFNFGIAFSIVCRSRMNILIGMKETTASKNYYKFCVLLTSIFGLILGSCLYAAKSYLVRLYSDSTPEMKDWFYRLMLVYFLVSWSEMSVSCVMLGLKSLQRFTLMLILNVFFTVCGKFLVGLSVFLVYKRCDYQLATDMGCFATLNLTILLISLLSDWNTLNSLRKSSDVPDLQ